MDRLQNAQMFTTLDLKDGFFHVPIDENSIKYTAFVVPDGHFEFLKVPFGLCNSPGVFQRFVRAVFRTLITNGVVLVYLDDLIIPAITEEDALQKLKQVLKVASEYGLIINWNKCELMVKKVEYLGYIIEAGHIRPSERKISAVVNFPEPKTIRQIQSFLGLTGYFRKFIPNFALHARPLSQLLKNGVKFVFGEKERLTFNSLKNFLIKKPILNLYQCNAETELHTDACVEGLGAILLQKNTEDNKFHPIYYASWKTTATEMKYTSYELEVLAVVKAIKKFRIYLCNIPFKIVTDCNAFVWSMKKKDLCLRVAHWALLIDEFNYTIEHRPGTSMRHVDALSRNAINVCLVQKDHNILIERIKTAQNKDSELSKIIKLVKNGQDNEFNLTRNGVLYREFDGKELMVIPKLMQYEIIKDTHEEGHFSWQKTEQILKREYWFPKMTDKIKKITNNCVKCVLVNKKQGKNDCFLNPIDKNPVPLDTYHIDHLGPLPSTKKTYNHIFVVIDGFTKFIWLYPVKNTTAEEVITKLNQQSITFGNPRRIISDRGPAFTSNIFKEYCNTENIQHVLITTGVPRANGQVERINRVIIPILSKLSIENPREWWKHVGIIQQIINSTFHRSIKKTPFEVMIGKKIRRKNDPELKQLVEEELLKIFELDRSEIREEARQNILKIQDENKKTFNRRRKKAIKYSMGDIVAI